MPQQETQIQELQKHPDYQRFYKLKAIEIAQELKEVDPTGLTRIFPFFSCSSGTMIHDAAGIKYIDVVKAV